MKGDLDQMYGGQGYRVIITHEDAVRMNLSLLGRLSKLRDIVVFPWFYPAEVRIEMLFFRKIFSGLRNNVHMYNVDTEVDEGDDSDENIPIDEFQRAFERLFFVLKDEEGFDANKYDEDGNGFVGWGEFCYVFKKRNIVIKASILEQIFQTFEDPESCWLGQLVNMIVLLAIITSSLCFILSTVPECQIHPSDGAPPQPHSAFDYVEKSCLLLFVAEYVIRLLTCWGVRSEVFDQSKLLSLTLDFETIQLPSIPTWLAWVPFELPAPLLRLLKFIFRSSNLIDIFAILPGVIGLAVDGVDGGGFVVLRLVRLTRIFRSVKSIRGPSVVIARTIQQSMKALYVLTFNLVLGIVIAGSLIYLSEGGRWDEESRSYLRVTGQEWNSTGSEYMKVEEESPFLSIPHSFWWAIVTASTVGYGDHYPTTPLGKIVSTAMMVFSLVILALPVGVTGENFSKQWAQYEMEKKFAVEDKRREMASITSAVQAIDPASMNKMLLLEVWNERFPSETPVAWGAARTGQAMTRPLPAEFMGWVHVELELSVVNPVSQTYTMPLNSDPDIVDRQIEGTVTFECTWTPSSAAVTDAKTTDHSGDDSHLHGSLTVTLIRADGLTNLQIGGASNPFVTVNCYPSAPANQGDIVYPAMWRAPTRVATLNPQWQAYHTFDFDWSRMRTKSTESTIKPGHTQSEGEEVAVMEITPRSVKPAECPHASNIDKLGSVLSDLSNRLNKVTEEVNGLTGRIEKIEKL